MVARDENDGRLFRCGNAKPIARPEKQPDSPENQSLYRLVSQPYLRAQIEALPASQQQDFTEGYRQLQEWSNGVLADAVAAARVLIEERERAFLGRFRVERRNGKKRPRERQSMVQLTLLKDLHMSVQTSQRVSSEPTKNGYEQTAEAYNGEIGAAQTSPFLNPPQGHSAEDLRAVSAGEASQPAREPVRDRGTWWDSDLPHKQQR
jgi:hypothetical protein